MTTPNENHEINAQEHEKKMVRELKDSIISLQMLRQNFNNVEKKLYEKCKELAEKRLEFFNKFSNDNASRITSQRDTSRLIILTKDDVVKCYKDLSLPLLDKFRGYDSFKIMHLLTLDILRPRLYVTSSNYLVTYIGEKN